MTYVLSLLLVLTASLHATDFVVTSTDDSGPDTLRQAITDANLMAGPHTISFNIAGTNPHQINLLSGLPALNQLITIDGTTQPGYANAPVVILRAVSMAAINAGLEAAFNGDVIKGLKITGFERGVIIFNAQQVTVNENVLTANNQGIQINNGQNNSITQNLITQNFDTGIFAFNGSTENQITLNEIMVNRNSGIYFDNTSTDNMMRENIITDNGAFGIEVHGINNVILTNSIFNNVLSGIVNGGIPLVSIGFTQVNYQVIACVPTISIQGTVKGLPDAVFKLQFFQNSINRAPVTEGERFLGELHDVVLDADGNATFFARFDLPFHINLPSFISATATEQLLGPIVPDKTTSEFTQNFPILSFESPISLAIKEKYCSN